MTALRTPVMLAAVAVSGCVSGFASSPAKVAATRSTEVGDILAIWQPGEGRDADGLPARGFAGRLFFFPPGSTTPAVVDGDVTVYVFDDQGTADEQAEPIHRFHFEAAAWDTYRTDSDVGTAYQLFLPYTRSGGHRAVCSLRVKFEPPAGSPTLSVPADVVLHGSDRAGQPDHSAALGVRPASYTAPATAVPPKTLRTQTIPLTGGSPTVR